MTKQTFTFNIFFIVISLSLLFLNQVNAQTITVSGTVYTDEGITPMADGRTVRIKANGAGDYSDLLDSGDGTYVINNILAESGTTLTVFLDGTAEKGTTVTKSGSADINNLDIYQNCIIARSDNADGCVSISHLTQYDKDHDTDIPFNADNGAGCAELTLTVDNGNVFYIWSGSTFLGHLSFATLDVDDIKIIGTYEQSSTIFVSGSWTNLGSVTILPAVTFNASSGTHYINSGDAPFDVVTFNDGGGGATWISEDGLEVATNLNITSGTLDTKTGENNPINLEGSWTNAGTFEARNGTVTFDDDQANSRTITSGGSAFYDLVINPTAAATYTLADTLEVNNNLTISAGTLDTKSGENNAIDVGGNWTNSAIFTARSGTVTFDGTGAQNVTTGGSNWSGIVITNAAAAGVTFKDKLTCETFTCTTPDAHLNFKFKEVADEKFEITASGGLHLEGAVDHPVLLRRYLGAEGDHWDIYPSGESWTVNYVDVMDSINSYAPFIDPSNSLDSGNNYNWFEQAICITQVYPATSIALSGELIYFSSSNAGDCGLEPSYSWEVASIIGSAINLDGIYASGNNDTGAPKTDTVTVTDIANSVTDTATVCVGDIDCELTISPSSHTVSSGEAIQFSGDKSAECNLAESYSWKVSSTLGSSINGSGFYTAGTNNTPSDITETVTVTDSNNCVIATATITVNGVLVITTTIPFTPTTTVPPVTTTTIPSDTTTTTTPLLTTTTTITSGCELTISPEAASVNPGETVTFEVSSTGDCDSPDYEWSLSSDTDSSIIPQGTTCIYTAGINESSEPLTDIITLTDMANGEISVSANITILPTCLLPSMTVSPGNMLRLKLLPIPVLMLIEGTNTHFDKKSSVISFKPVTSVFSLPPLVLNETTISSLILVLPSWFATAEDTTVTIVVSTGSEVVSDTFEIKMLPSRLDIKIITKD